MTATVVDTIAAQMDDVVPDESPTPPPAPPEPPQPVPVDLSSYFTEAQIAQLLAPIRPNRVSVKEGQSHLEAYDVRAHLNRCLGFGRWSGDVLFSELMYEEIEGERVWNPEKKGYGGKIKPGWDDHRSIWVAYRVRYRLVVKAPDGTELATYTEEAMGDAANFPGGKRMGAHDFALKTAESQALKRCAINLGDQFGLSLYAKGSLNAIVGGTHVHAERVPVTAQPPATKSIDEGMAAVVEEVAPEHADLPTGDPAEAGVDPATGQVPDRNPQPAIRFRAGEAATPSADTDGPTGGYGEPEPASAVRGPVQGQVVPSAIARAHAMDDPSGGDMTGAEPPPAPTWRSDWPTPAQMAAKIAAADAATVDTIEEWLAARHLLEVEEGDYTLAQYVQGRRDALRDEAKRARTGKVTPAPAPVAAAPAAEPGPLGIPRQPLAEADVPDLCGGKSRTPLLTALADRGITEAMVAEHFGRPTIGEVGTRRISEANLASIRAAEGRAAS